MTRSRVLIIDDSAYNRTTLSRIVAADPEFEVLPTASNGEEGLRRLLSEKPDIVTLDLDMPRMDGFTFLRIVMQKMPVPVVVVSSQSTAENVFRALELGAIDFIPKPTSSISERLSEVGEELLTKLRAARRSRTQAIRPAAEAPSEPRVKPVIQQGVTGLVVIGTSTGGPGALQHLFSNLPVLPVGFVVAQHMPAGFTRTFAERLDRLSPYHVSEARGGEEIAAGHVFIGPGGRNILVNRGRTGLRVRLQNPEGDRYVPSVDRLFTSAAKVGLPTLALILTGMGDDGAVGAQAIRVEGGTLFVESEETCIVHGMPREAARRAGAQRVLPLGDIARAIEGWVQNLRPGAAT